MCFVATPAAPSGLPAINVSLLFHLKASLCFKTVSNCLAIVTISLEKPLSDFSDSINIDGVHMAHSQLYREGSR